MLRKESSDDESESWGGLCSGEHLAMADNDPTAGRDLRWFIEHIQRYMTDPVAAHDWDASTNPQARASGLHPTLFLATTGRKTGERRSIPLLYQPTGDGFIVVASKGGTDAHPAWYANLLANPECEVTAGSFVCTATARTLTGDERQPYWEWMVRFWPDYEVYQSRTAREIPVVVLKVDTVRVAH